MNVRLAYGRHGIEIELPDDAVVIRSRYKEGLTDELAGVRRSLRQPIAAKPLVDLAGPGDTVVIVHSDITRATPNDRILPVILDELETAGVARDNITLLNALGTHRPQTKAELKTMLGERIVEDYRCIQHDAFDDANLVSLGGTSLGHPVRINRCYMDADVKILTGFIEPHFFAGFSGGPKAVLPALAGAESVLTNHGYQMIGHQEARWGVTNGNPIWEEMRDVALRTEPDFLVNVTLNTDGRITGIFAGDLVAAHRQGCEFARESAMVAVKEPFDVVLTTNSGYPLDQNLYQCVKGMSAAQQIVRKGGGIVLAGACEDGIPEHGRYAELLRQGGSAQGILDMVSVSGFEAQDQWQVQIQAQIQLHADVFVYSDGLTDHQIRDALLVPSRNIEGTIRELQKKFGYGAKICVLPEGPQTIAFLNGDGEADGTLH